MFASCRYIKVLNSKTLIDSLSNVWIGKLRLHANVARFARKEEAKRSHAGAKAAKERLIWLEIEGVPLRAWNNDMFTQICCQWGEGSMGMYAEKEEKVFEDNDAESVVGLSDDIGDVRNIVHNDLEQESEHEILVSTIKESHGIGGIADQETMNTDPFGIDSLIKQRYGKASEEKCSMTPKFPSGFSSNSTGNHQGSIVVYAPRNLSSKIDLWSSLANLIVNWDGNLAVMVDSILCVVLEKGNLDHLPILLKDFEVDYGPTPFCFFHSGLDMDGFHNLIVHTWNHDGTVNVSSFISFKKNPESQTYAEVDQRCASEEDLINHRDSIQILEDIQCLEAKVTTQKARIKWAFEGDENTRCRITKSTFFYSKNSWSSNSLVMKSRGLFEIVDFLDLVMEKLGFVLKWCSWIFDCLYNARSSVLVNGSPTSEFEMFRGLRQGDPLSPFLFILAMKGLHLLMCKAEELGLFKGALFSHGNMSISHLIYADDDIGCGAAIFPMKYLGVPVRYNMARCSNWSAIVQKFSSKLALWKARLLSVSGWLSLIKSVLGHRPTYYMSIYMMPISIQKKLESMRNNFFLVLTGQCDSWQWSLDVSAGFSVAFVRSLIDSNTLDTDSNATRWNHSIPTKANVFIWRLMLNKLPSRVNLDRKGIDVGSILCPIFQVDVETINHIFFSCDMAMDLWDKLARWWELDIPVCANIWEWFEWLGSLHVSNKLKLVLEGVGGLLCGLYGVLKIKSKV
ncbi:RNA-directed DNA polymerase, eukaryota, reverse transcriptase zinc-binding domain protein [Tanacetum coccineum]